MWRRYIGGRVSAGSLGSSLPSPGSRVTGVFVPRLLWATDEKENVGRTVYCGAPAGSGAHNRPPLCEGFSLNDLSDAFNSSRDSKECWGRVAAWTVGKKTARILISENTQPALRAHLVSYWFCHSVRYPPSPRIFGVKRSFKIPETLRKHFTVGYFTYRSRCLRILFIKILSSSRKLPDVIVFQRFQPDFSPHEPVLDIKIL